MRRYPTGSLSRPSSTQPEAHGLSTMPRSSSSSHANPDSPSLKDREPLMRGFSPDHDNDDGDENGPYHDRDTRGSRSHAKAGGSSQDDVAAGLLRKLDLPPGTRINVKAEDDSRVLSRIDWCVLPLMLAVYFLQGLDKATIALASVFGLIEDTGLKGDEYSWLGSVVYIAQLLMQFPLAWLLVKLPIGKFTSCMVALWGITLTAMAGAYNFRTLLVARFFLGAFEASIAPSFIAITQMFWRRREQPVRMSYWYAMNGFTNLFGSLMTWALASVPLNLKPYQTIFIFFGIITVAFSTVLFSYMPDSPAEAKFLSDHDKLIAIERLRANQTGVVSRTWRWPHLWETLLDLKTWFWFALVFSISIPSGGVASFGPLLVKSFGFDSFQAILFNAPFGIVQLISTVGGGFLAQKYQRKGPVIALLSIGPIAGIMLMMATPHNPQNRATLLFGYYLISVYPGIIPLMYSWSAANTAGDTKRKCTSSVIFLGQSLGNIIGPLLYKPSEAPEYYRGLQSNLMLYFVIIGLIGVTSIYLSFLNRSHSKRRVAMGKSATVVDYSLLSSEEADRLRRAGHNLPIDDERGGHEYDEENDESKAFEDLTDLQNEDFVYVF